MGLSALGCAVAVLLPGAARAAAQAPVPPTARVLVMPFENEPREGRTYWISEAAAVLLGDDLRALGRRPISRDERVEAFERLGLPVRASLSDATMIKVAELVGAQDVIIGSFALEGEELVVNARSIRLGTGRLQTRATGRGRLAELYQVFDQVAVRLYGVAGQELTRAGETAHGPLAAFENHIKGLLAENPAAQAKFLEAAIELHPRYDAARLALWSVWAGQNEHARALAVLEGVGEPSPFYTRARFAAGRSQLELKRYDEAFVTWSALQQRAPAPVLNNLGVLQLRRGASSQGGSPTYYFNQAVEADRSNPHYYFNLGYAYTVARDPQAAIYWLREAVRRNPADGQAHYVLGTLLLSTGSRAEGTREMELARRLSSDFEEWDKRPASDPIPRGLERLQERPQSEPSVDLAFVTTEQRDQRELAAFHLERGRRLFDQEHDREALVELRRALYLSPYHAEAHLLLGRVYLRQGLGREAIDALKISLWSEETASAHVVLAEAYLQAKDEASARVEAERALVLDPKSEDARRVLARLQIGRL